MNRCSECGEEYLEAGETRINGEPLHLCPPCADEAVTPTVDFAFWED